MRTVTFSDPEVARYVNENFIPAWQNIRPEFHNCDLGTEQRIAVYQGEIFPTKNIFTFVLEPEARVLTYLSGFYAPAWFLEELKFGVEVWRALVDEEGIGRPDGSRRFIRLHEDRMARCKEQAKELARRKVKEAPEGLAAEVRDRVALFPLPESGARSSSRKGTERIDSPKNLVRIQEERLTNIADAMESLYQIHRHLANQVRQHGRLHPLKKSGYRYGNDFAEH